jgi:hypothetical protein
LSASVPRALPAPRRLLTKQGEIEHIKPRGPFCQPVRGRNHEKCRVEQDAPLRRMEFTSLARIFRKL